MNRIFFQIFFTFWLITVAIVFTSVSVSRYVGTLEKSDQGPSPYQLKKMAKEILTQTANISESLSAKELEVWLYTIPRVGSIDAYIINLVKPNLSTQAPEHINDISKSLTLDNPLLEIETQTTAIFGQLLSKDNQVLAKLLIEIPLPPSPLVYFFTKYIWLRLLAAFTVSGLICYVVARFISKPIEGLRKATQALAEGNLATRFDEKQFSSDELKRLGHDFNYMAEHLQETIENQKQLVRDISHELRSPIGRIQAALALAQVKHGEDEAELQRVEKECGRLNTLVNQLLIMPNYNQPMDSCIDLVSLLNGIASDDELQALQTNKKMIVSSPLQELLVTTSGNLLWHAIDNLTQNALKHTPENTTVTLSLKHDKPNKVIQVIVTDEGKGVPEADLKKIFQPFYRIDQARGHESDSHGLGLSIAYRAIKHHQGTIIAKNIDKGFQVAITLPDSLITSSI